MVTGQTSMDAAGGRRAAGAGSGAARAAVGGRPAAGLGGARRPGVGPAVLHRPREQDDVVGAPGALSAPPSGGGGGGGGGAAPALRQTQSQIDRDAELARELAEQWNVQEERGGGGGGGGGGGRERTESSEEAGAGTRKSDWADDATTTNCSPTPSSR